MQNSPNIAALAADLADPARARMLLALMDGRARTVSELGAVAGLAKASASEHVARLVAAGLLSARRQGRHKYVSLSSAQVAHLVEAMMVLAADVRSPAPPPRPLRSGPRDPALRAARTCYQHLAGNLGVSVYDSLTSRGFLQHCAGGLDLTGAGRSFVQGLGLDEADLGRGAAPLCRDCLDWSERRHHLAGRLGRLLLQKMLAADWLRPTPGSRALHITPKGRGAFAVYFPPGPVDLATAVADAARNRG